MVRIKPLSAVCAFGLLAWLATAQNPPQSASGEAPSFRIGAFRVDVGATDGRLVFQKRNAAGEPVGEPWYWPEEASDLRYEDPRLVEKADGTWLVFRERSADGSVRSRAISLSEVFADGFDAGTTAAWSSTEPAVNLFIESPAEDAAIADATPAIVVRFGTPTGIARCSAAQVPAS